MADGGPSAVIKFFIVATAIRGLSGMCAETRGPGDNSKTGNNRWIEAGRKSTICIRHSALIAARFKVEKRPSVTCILPNSAPWTSISSTVTTSTRPQSHECVALGFLSAKRKHPFAKVAPACRRLFFPALAMSLDVKDRHVPVDTHCMVV